MRLRVTMALLAGAFFFAPAAQATIYCVNNVSALDAAFSSANSAPEGSVQDIRVRPGTYAVSAGLIFYPAGGKDGKEFSLTGGWNSDCSARTTNPSATILDALNGGNNGIFNFGGDQARYTVEGIRFENFVGFYLADPACGIGCPDTQSMRVRYNEFRNGRKVQINTEDAATFTVSNNLFTGINSESGLSPIYIYYRNNETLPVIAFNTFAEIACIGGGNKPAVQILTEVAGATLHHNIIESSCTSDIGIDATGQPVALRNNLYFSRSGLAPSASSNNVISDVPGFVNAGGGNFHLKETAPISPAINTGMTPVTVAQLALSATIPGQDLDGPAGARLVGTRYDIGAYESSINDSSTLLVVNTNDSGAGSLRAAITAANAAPGAQRVDFALPAACPQLILLDSPLPDIVDDLEINGYSQTGSSPNTLTNGSDAEICVVILASSGTLAQALLVPDAAPAATSLTVRGIAFAGSTGFNGNFTVAVRVRGGSYSVIQGNAFSGTGPGSVGSLGTLNFGMQIRGNAQNALIGGTEPEHRNSFGATTSSAIVLNDATSNGHIIQNNYIGLSANGQQASPIGLNGIFASESANVQILDNVIAAVANSAAISITGANATGYTIARNRLGMNAFSIPTAAMRNGTGIQIASGSGGHLIGSVASTAISNIITNSDDAGIWITPTAGTGILARPNQIYDNGKSGVGLGIDIGTLGQSSNDPLDTDGGPNNGQNFPSLTSSLPDVDGNRVVGYSLSSAANTTYRIDIYRSVDCPAGNRGANLANRIATVTGTTNAQGVLNGSVTASSAGAPGVLSAVATQTTTRDTSEPGLCFIEPNTTTTTITSDLPDPSEYGQLYTVNVLVSSASGTPTGSVTISDGQGVQCSDNTLVGGAASCQLLSTSLGNKTLTAEYSGSLAHAPSSGTASHSVGPATTTTTIVSDQPDASEVGQPYTVSVQVRTLAGNTTTPGGQVSISDGSGQTCQIVALSNGDGSCQLTSVSVGNKVLSASYPGTLFFQPSSDTEAHTVVAASTITTIASDAPDPSLPGQTYTVAVTVTSLVGTPTGSVAVSDGSGAQCNVTLAGGGGSCQLSSAALGNKTLTATYAPNSQAWAASSDTEGHLIALTSTITTITSDVPDPSIVGQPYVVQVQVNGAGGTPTGTVAISDGSGANCNAVLNAGTGQCQLTSTSAGNKVLTANYPGDASFAASSDTEAHIVNNPAAAATTTTITSQQPATSVVGEAYLVSVSVTSPGNTPTGTVLVNNGAGPGSSNCQISLINGSGSCQLPSTSAGSTLTTACMQANASYAGSCDSAQHTTNKADTTLSFQTFNPPTAVIGQPVTATVALTISAPGAGTATGLITVSASAAESCQITLPATTCQLTLSSLGSRSISASYAGDANFNASIRTTTLEVVANGVFANGFE